MKTTCEALTARLSNAEISQLCDNLECDLADVMNRILSAANQPMHDVTHNAVFWKYLATRSFGMLRFLQICRETNFLPGDQHISFESMEELWGRYEGALNSFTDEMLNVEQNSDTQYDYDESPFNSAILSIRNLERVAASINNESSDQYHYISDMIKALGELDKSCYRLQNDGLPRAVLRVLKKKYASDLVQQMERLSLTINNTIIHPNIWADI